MQQDGLLEGEVPVVKVEATIKTPVVKFVVFIEFVVFVEFTNSKFEISGTESSGEFEATVQRIESNDRSASPLSIFRNTRSNSSARVVSVAILRL
jgi:hypothetical protein